MLGLWEYFWDGGDWYIPIVPQSPRPTRYTWRDRVDTYTQISALVLACWLTIWR